MTRLNLDAPMSWQSYQSSMAAPDLLGMLSAGADSFDAHLQQAQQATSKTPNDSIPEPPPEPKIESRRSDGEQQPERSASTDASAEHSSKPTESHVDDAASRHSHSSGDRKESGESGTASHADTDRNASQHAHHAKGDADESTETTADAGKATGSAKGRRKHGNNAKSPAAANHDGQDVAAEKATAKSEPATTAPVVSSAQSPEPAPAVPTADPLAVAVVTVDATATHETDATDKAVAANDATAALAAQGAAQSPDGSTIQTAFMTPGENLPGEIGQPVKGNVAGTDMAEGRPARTPAAAGAGRKAGVRQTSRAANENRAANNETQAAENKPDAPLAALDAIPIPVDGDAERSAHRPETAGQATKPEAIDAAKGTAAVQPVVGRGQSTAASQRTSQPQSDGVSSDATERVRFVQRVARAFGAAADGGGSIRLRLHPAELGSLRLELTVRNGVMNARIETDTQAAQAMLTDNLPALKERLAEHQIKVERFDIQWQTESQGGLPQNPGDQSRWQPPSTGTSAHGVAGAGREAEVQPSRQAPARTKAPASFDVVI